MVDGLAVTVVVAVPAPLCPGHTPGRVIIVNNKTGREQDPRIEPRLHQVSNAWTRLNRRGGSEDSFDMEYTEPTLILQQFGTNGGYGRYQQIPDRTCRNLSIC